MDFLSEFFSEYGQLLVGATWETIVMTFVPSIVAYIIGIPLGVLLVLTSPKGLRPHRVFNAILGWIANIGRSIPFVILMVVLIPFTRIVVGTSIGLVGALVPLSVAAAPFVARMVEQSILEVDGGLIEAAQSFGASVWQIVGKVFLKESIPSLVRGASIVLITVFGYSAIAGLLGGGGLGDLAIRYGYHRYQFDVMMASLIICVIFVQIIQGVLSLLSRSVDKR